MNDQNKADFVLEEEDKGNRADGNRNVPFEGNIIYIEKCLFILRTMLLYAEIKT